jgi:serine/threonine-protein phosphatase 2A activator
MYNAEVLSKFPVVQHFPFGSLFSWNQDPLATQVAASVHTASQPSSHPSASNAPMISRSQQETTRVPWAVHSGPVSAATAAPWANAKPQLNNEQATRAPWATAPPTHSKRDSRATNSPQPSRMTDSITKAPWAINKGSDGS